MSEVGKMPSQIEGQDPPPPEKKLKIGGGGDGAEEKDGGEKGSTDAKSSDEAEASKLEGGTKMEEDGSEDDSSVEWEWVTEGPDYDYMKYYEEKNLPEKILNIFRSPPKPNPDIDYCLIGNYKVDWDLWEEYFKQIEETEGFGVRTYPGECGNAYLRPITYFKESEFYTKLVFELADLAIKQFNEDNIGKEFKVVDVEWVVDAPACGIMYFLTFKAEDPKDGVKTFEAKVLNGVREEREVELCRIKKQEAAA